MPTVYRRANGLWAGSVEVHNAGGRNRKAVSSMLFCHLLPRLADLQRQHPPRARPRRPESLGSRRANMIAARERGTHTPAEWYAKLRAQHGLCHYCGQRGVRMYRGRPTYALVKDHMTPVCRGGADTIDNVVGACEPCNIRKRTMTADEYAEVLNRAD